MSESIDEELREIDAQQAELNRKYTTTLEVIIESLPRSNEFFRRFASIKARIHKWNQKIERLKERFLALQKQQPFRPAKVSKATRSKGRNPKK